MQGQTQSDKAAADTTVWKAWLDKYTDSVKEELAGAQDKDEALKARKTLMDSTNPRYGCHFYVNHLYV